MKELINIQNELKAPKGQYNSFGKYKYRSCEDILESVKPLLHKYECHLTMLDDIMLIGDRYYVRATVILSNKEGKTVSTTALAREEETKKGMDASQITGASSSYARKYALNGLFCIDDTKDSDATNTHGEKEISIAEIIADIRTSTSREELIKKHGLYKGYIKTPEVKSAFEEIGKKYPK